MSQIPNALMQKFCDIYFARVRMLLLAQLRRNVLTSSKYWSDLILRGKIPILMSLGENLGCECGLDGQAGDGKISNFGLALG